MKTSILIALAGIVAVVAVAGLVVAASPGSQLLGSQSGYGGGSGMMGSSNGGHGDGGMMGDGHMHQNQWSGQAGSYGGYGPCHEYEWNYSYDRDNCPCG